MGDKSDFKDCLVKRHDKKRKIVMFCKKNELWSRKTLAKEPKVLVIDM